LLSSIKTINELKYHVHHHNHHKSISVVDALERHNQNEMSVQVKSNDIMKSDEESRKYTTVPKSNQNLDRNTVHTKQNSKKSNI
jgi:chorismate-pyruvate lyase